MTFKDTNLPVIGRHDSRTKIVKISQKTSQLPLKNHQKTQQNSQLQTMC